MTTTQTGPQTVIDLDEVARIARRYHDNPAQLMRLLFTIEAIAANSIPREVATVVCRETGIPEAKLFGFLTFYAMFSPVPRGRHLVRICTSGSCFLNGAQQIRDAVCASLGVEIGGTTADGQFTVELCQCLGTCDQSPAAMVDATTRGPLTPRGALALIEESVAHEDEE
jgi:NADH:ubiquinone oxidoreductase subunit E